MADHRRLLMERQVELNEEEAGNLLGELLESSGVGSESDTQSEDGGPIDGEQSDKSVQQSDADQQRDDDGQRTDDRGQPDEGESQPEGPLNHPERHLKGNSDSPVSVERGEPGEAASDDPAEDDKGAGELFRAGGRLQIAKRVVEHFQEWME